MIQFGSDKIKEIYVGSDKIKEVYKGNEKIFSSEVIEWRYEIYPEEGGAIYIDSAGGCVSQPRIISKLVEYINGVATGKYYYEPYELWPADPGWLYFPTGTAEGQVCAPSNITSYDRAYWISYYQPASDAYCSVQVIQEKP